MEKFVTFSIGHLNSSLAKLVNNLAGKDKNGKNPEDVFTNTLEYFKTETLDDDKFKMLTYERFDEDKLPGKEAFFSDLSKEHISQEDFEILHKLWKEFWFEESWGDI